AASRALITTVAQDAPSSDMSANTCSFSTTSTSPKLSSSVLTFFHCATGRAEGFRTSIGIELTSLIRKGETQTTVARGNTRSNDSRESEAAALKIFPVNCFASLLPCARWRTAFPGIAITMDRASRTLVHSVAQVPSATRNFELLAG